MIVEKHISFLRLVRLIWRRLICILLVSALPVAFMLHFDLRDYAIHASIPMVIGTAIAIFLGFRTNSAYDRWWEARKIWGHIVNDSRNLVRLCNDLIGAIDTSDGDGDAEEVDREVTRQICHRQIAWVRVLSQRLKGLPWGGGLRDLLSESEQVAIKRSQDPVLLLLAEQGKSIREALRRGRLDTRELVLLEETVSRLTSHYGACQRIKNTCFPAHYAFFARVFIWIFLVLLGVSLPAHENANYSLVAAIFLIGWAFFMVEGIGNYMQDPFVNNRNVIPMDAMARVIERDLREAIGEDDLPPMLEPIEGALY